MGNPSIFYRLINWKVDLAPTHFLKLALKFFWNLLRETVARRPNLNCQRTWSEYAKKLHVMRASQVFLNMMEGIGNPAANMRAFVAWLLRCDINLLAIDRVSLGASSKGCIENLTWVTTIEKTTRTGDSPSDHHLHCNSTQGTDSQINSHKRNLWWMIQNSIGNQLRQSSYNLTNTVGISFLSSHCIGIWKVMTSAVQ